MLLGTVDLTGRGADFVTTVDLAVDETLALVNKGPELSLFIVKTEC